MMQQHAIDPGRSDRHRLEIHTASDPQEGLEAFKSIRPRIVLVDLMMPTMTGMDLLDVSYQNPGVE